MDGIEAAGRVIIELHHLERGDDKPGFLQTGDDLSNQVAFDRIRFYYPRIKIDPVIVMTKKSKTLISIRIPAENKIYFFSPSA